jgi:hypothetical protein
MIRKTFLIFFLILSLVSVANAQFNYHGNFIGDGSGLTGIPWSSLTGIPVRAADCTSYITAGQFCQDTGTGALYVGNGASAVQLATGGAVPSASTTTPSMDGSAAYGSSVTWARGDHVHPTDTSRQPLNPTEYDNGTCTTSKSISAVNGSRQKVTLTNGNTCAFTFVQPSSGTVTILLKIIQSTTSTYNGTISGGLWPGGSPPTITATTGAIDIISCYLDGTNAYCVPSQDFR